MSEAEQQTVNCSNGTEGHYDLGLHIAAIFIIFTASIIGVLFPIITSRFPKMAFLQRAFFIAKFFGSGVIITTGLIHIFPEAVEILSDECLPDWFVNYPTAGLFALIACLVMHMIEWSGTYHVRLSNDGEGKKEKEDQDCEAIILINQKEHNMTTLTLELGIMVHSVVIGVSLGLATDEFVALLIALCFHQLFEGIGLGSLLSQVDFRTAWLGVATGFVYALSTPVGVAIGIGVKDGSQSPVASQLAIGIFESFAAGLLIYSGLVGLLSKGFTTEQFFALATCEKVMCFASLWIGCACMASLAIWA